MQGLSAKGFQRGAGSGRELSSLGLETRAVNVVAEQRMADGGEVDADLVRAARLQPAGEQARDRLPLAAAIAFEHLPMRDRCATALAHGHPFARVRMAPDRLVDGAAGALRRAPDESQIAA